MKKLTLIEQIKADTIVRAFGCMSCKPEVCGVCKRIAEIFIYLRTKKVKLRTKKTKQGMTTAIRYAIFGVLSVILAVFLVWVADYGLKRFEALECQKWLYWEKTIPDWYSTNWQKEQCLRFGIKLRQPKTKAGKLAGFQVDIWLRNNFDQSSIVIIV